jgi:hypothetical protein
MRIFTNKNFKNWISLSGAVTLLLVTFWLISYIAYFFNPITFKKDHVTYLPWSWYENPLTIEYMVLGKEGWLIKKVDERKEVKFVIDELKDSPVIQDPEREEYKTSDNTIRRIMLRRGDDVILLEVSQEWEGNVYNLSHNQVFIKVSKELEELLMERFSQAEDNE